MGQINGWRADLHVRLFYCFYILGMINLAAYQSKDPLPKLKDNKLFWMNLYNETNADKMLMDIFQLHIKTIFDKFSNQTAKLFVTDVTDPNLDMKLTKFLGLPSAKNNRCFGWKNNLSTKSSYTH